MSVKDRLRIVSKGLSLSDDWPWNPYKGWTVEGVINHAPGYVESCMGRGILLDNEAYRYYEDQAGVYGGYDG